jgi:hypothetical protein
MQTPDPFQGMTPGELAQRYPDIYPASPKYPTLPSAPSPTMDGLGGLPPNELAKSFPQFYPDGPSSKIPDLPSPNVPDPINSMTGPELAQRFPQFYPDAAPAPTGLPASFSEVPTMPVESPPGLPLGTLNGPVGSGVLGGALAGVMGVASGQPLEVAAGEALGAGVGGYLGALAGAGLGPAGLFIGGSIGSSFGGYLGGNLAKNIHDAFFPPSQINVGPHDPVQLPPNVPGGYPPGTIYRVRFASQGRVDELRMRTFSGAGFEPKDAGFKPRTMYAYGVDVYGSSPGTLRGIYTDIPISISVIPEVNGVPQRELPQIPNFVQTPYRQPMIIGLPDLRTRIPPIPKVATPPTLPQAEPQPRRGPQVEPPGPANSPTPKIAPSKPADPSPTGDPNAAPEGGPSTGGGNLNNLPGLFGFPFIPAVMPANKPSPPGSLDIDPGNGPTGTGKPPKAPTNSPCSGACQRAIEGRIQGVDDKLSGLLQGGNNLGQDAALAEILRRLTVLDAKVGTQVPGGLSGFLGLFREAFDKLSTWLHLDRLLNIMTFIVTLQNAYFLTDSLKIVTLQMLSDGLNVLGFKDKDGNGLNLNKLLDKTIEDMLKSVLGVDTLEGMKKEWKALSRIYQAGSNIIYAFQNIAWSILNALDIIGSWNAQIGNALKKYGVVGHNAFAWLNPAPNFHNKFFTAVTNALNIVSNLDFVAQSIIQGRDAVDQITKQSEEFSKDFTDLTNPTPPEHKPTAAAAAASTTHSQSPPPTNDDLNNVI